jgi:hypothetical protein
MNHITEGVTLMNPNEPGLRPYAVRWLCAVALAASLVTVASPALAAESGNVDGTFTPVLSGACILIDGPSSIAFGNVQRGAEFQFGTPSNVRIIPCAADTAPYEIAVSATDATTSGPTPSTISLAGPAACPTVTDCTPTGDSFALQTNGASPIYTTPQTVATNQPNNGASFFSIGLKVSSQLDTAAFGQAFSFDVTFTAFLE